jgi:hypothetical protein
MTKRDYDMLADLIAYTQDQVYKGRIQEADEVMPFLMQLFIDQEKVMNPRFNAEKFSDACGT